MHEIHRHTIDQICHLVDHGERLFGLITKCCLSKGDSYSRIVFASAEGKNLWNIQAIKSMCNFDNTRVCCI